MSCIINKTCDFCDSTKCANYYEETEDYIAIYNQVLMPDGTCKCGKIVRYKFPKYDEQTGKQILLGIVISDDK